MKHWNIFYHSLKELSYKRKLILTCLIVGIFPLSITSIFSYYQLKNTLIKQEMASLSSALNTANSSLNFQVSLYENLLLHIAGSSIIIDTAQKEYHSLYDKYEQFHYHYDVFLNHVYSQYPQIKQITLYVDNPNLQHGKQLQSKQALLKEEWYQKYHSSIQAKPTWFVNSSHDLILIAKIPEPYVQYIKKYSKNYICITIPSSKFFHFVEEISTNYHLKIKKNNQILFEYTTPSILPLMEKKQTSLTNTTRDHWSILLEKPTYLIQRPATKMLFVMCYILLFCLLLIFLLSTILSNFSVRRIYRLHKQMQIVKSGNFDIQIYDDCHDEIGELTNSFQEMANEIHMLIEENYTNKITLKDTQLKALQAQINPHFLYNCLSLINSRALLNNQIEISQMSQLMSTFYRTTLNKGRSHIPIQDEIKNVISYIDIQKLLHENAFEVMYQIDQQFPNISVPNLLLQPLVENSIVHGLLPKEGNIGRLFLTVRQIEQQIHITIMDNGVGIPSEKIPYLTETDSDGYGLKNVNQRLQLTYGNDYGLIIHSIPNESTMISFSIPLNENKTSTIK